MDNAFRYVEKFGIESEADYTYQAEDEKCKYDPGLVVDTITGFKDVTPDSVDQLMAACAQQPVSIAVEAD
jgi:hypothetical protein